MSVDPIVLILVLLIFLLPKFEAELGLGVPGSAEPQLGFPLSAVLSSLPDSAVLCELL